MHKLLDILEETLEKTAADMNEKAAVNIFSWEDLKLFNAIGEAIEHAECHISKHKEDAAMQSTSSTGERQEYQYIHEELNDAKKYCKAWIKTGDPTYEKLALGEVEDAEALIVLLKNNAATAKDIHFANEATNTINAIKAKLNKPAAK